MNIAKWFQDKRKLLKVPEYGTKEWFEYQFGKADDENFGGDKWGHRWRGTQRFRHRYCLSLIQDKVKVMRRGKILDIACGLCDFTELIYEVNHSNTIYVTDISENAVRYVKGRYKEFVATVSALPEVNFPNTSMDVVVCLEVLNYLNKEELRMSLRNISRVIKSDGVFLVSGVVSRDKRYFDEAEFVNEIGQFFSPIKIGYLYNFFEDYFERPFLKILNYLNKLEVVFNKRMVVANGVKMICGSERRTQVFNWLSKKMLKDKGKTHIIILCQKK